MLDSVRPGMLCPTAKNRNGSVQPGAEIGTRSDDGEDQKHATAIAAYRAAAPSPTCRCGRGLLGGLLGILLLLGQRLPGGLVPVVGARAQLGDGAAADLAGVQLQKTETVLARIGDGRAGRRKFIGTQF